MNYNTPGIATRYLIQEALNSKGLATLAREEDKLNSRDKKAPEYIHPTNFPYYGVKEARKIAAGKTPDEVLTINGSIVKYNKRGERILSSYSTPSDSYTYRDIGVDEKELIKGVKLILSGGLNLRNSELETAGSIKTVYGDITIDEKSKIKDLSSIQEHRGLVILDLPEDVDTKKFLKSIKYNPEYSLGKVMRLPHSLSIGWYYGL